jgi:hypothetical protein
MFSNRTLISERWRRAEEATVEAVTAVLQTHPDTHALPDLGLTALVLVYAVEAAVDAVVLRPPDDDEAAVAVLVAMIRKAHASVWASASESCTDPDPDGAVMVHTALI